MPAARQPRADQAVRWPRTAGHLAACLALGAVATLSIAWGIASRTPISPRAGTISYGGPAMHRGAVVGFATTYDPGVVRVHLHSWRGAGALVPPGAVLETHREHLPSWSAAAPFEGDWRTDTPEPLLALSINEMGFGWPMVTMLSRIAWSPPPQTVSGIDIGDEPGLPPLRRYLPTIILWPRFLASTLLWAAPLSAPVLFGAFRGLRRRRLGRCVPCGYDLRGAPGERCPECGAARGATGQKSAFV